MGELQAIDNTCTSCQLSLDDIVPFQNGDLWKKSCTSCMSNMVLRESKNPAHESEWACECGFKEYSQKSLFDQQQTLIAINQGKKDDYLSEEVRASFLERIRRRTICAKCPDGKGQEVCGQCGCRIKHRTYYSDLACPASNW